MSCQRGNQRWNVFTLPQDKPDGFESTVAPVKEKGNVCAPCYYVSRGSFKDVRQQDLREAMDTHASVKQKPPGP